MQKYMSKIMQKNRHNIYLENPPKLVKIREMLRNLCEEEEEGEGGA